jgi:hypothetical protein
MGMQIIPDIKDYSSTKWVAHILFLIMFLIEVTVLLCWNLHFTHGNDNGNKAKDYLINPKQIIHRPNANYITLLAPKVCVTECSIF